MFYKTLHVRQMKLPLKYFLVLSLLLGAVALPLGYKYFKARREAEIERLTERLEELWIRYEQPHEPHDSNPLYGSFPLDIEVGKYQRRQRRIEQEAATIEARLEKLTGKKPERPQRPTLWLQSPAR